jgi:putative ABC transport system substrate-binding protein
VRRRDAIILLGLGALLRPLGAGAQHQRAVERVWRVGLLTPVDNPVVRTVILGELAKRGFVEDRNLKFDLRVGTAEEMSELARALIANKSDVIVAVSDWAVHPAHAATTAIPIVAAPMGADPVAAGVAESWGHPGGNVTGVSLIAPELEVKRFALLHETVPSARRIALLSNHRAVVEIGLPALRAAASKSGLELIEIWVESSGEYPDAFRRMRAAGVDALEIVDTPEINRDVEQLAALAAEARLPSVGGLREDAQRGALIGYGPSLRELVRQAAGDVARILDGAKPGELPFQGPTRLDFALNLKTAKALGLAIPPAILAQADEVIE